MQGEKKRIFFIFQRGGLKFNLSFGKTLLRWYVHQRIFLNLKPSDYQFPNSQIINLFITLRGAEVINSHWNCALDYQDSCCKVCLLMQGKGFFLTYFPNYISIRIVNRILNNLSKNRVWILRVFLFPTQPLIVSILLLVNTLILGINVFVCRVFSCFVFLVFFSLFLFPLFGCRSFGGVLSALNRAFYTLDIKIPQRSWW